MRCSGLFFPFFSEAVRVKKFIHFYLFIYSSVCFSLAAIRTWLRVESSSRESSSSLTECGERREGGRKKDRGEKETEEKSVKVALGG